ncbi:MAG: HAD family hydrolase [Prevotella sp.]|nr:HAD family hydrolase [Prevotella sp.]MCM1074145.1 HAD family hydrolase [Ruminococcus sp.]
MGKTKQEVNNPSPIGVLFDLDGVLIDSERQYTRIWAEVDEMYPTGVPDFPRIIKGMTLANILDKYFDKSLHQTIIDYCVSEELKLTFSYMPGVRELLNGLHSRKVPVAMVTSSDAEKMKKLDSKMPDLLPRFDVIVIGEMVKHGKPAPDPYLLGAKKIGVPPHRCAVIEDSLTGLASGKAAGAFTIGMTDTLGRTAIEPNADITLDSLVDINLDTLILTLQCR